MRLDSTIFSLLYSLLLLFAISVSSLQELGPSLPPSDAIPPDALGTSRIAPALFVFGDSSVDSGNNNYLFTLAHADMLPYGRDFDTHTPTGRFCNGRIPVDYIGEFSHCFSNLASDLRDSMTRLFREFEDGSVESMMQGVNFASAGAGVLFLSGSDLGQHISLLQQTQQAKDTFQQFMLSMGEEAANDMISKSVFYLSIGNNDYIHYYLRNASRVQSLFQPWEFSQLLATNIKQELKNLYNANVRKVVIMGLAPLGCTPHYLWEYNSKGGLCVSEINDMVIAFNFAMREMVDELHRELPDAKITFCDVFEGAMDILQNCQHYGFETITDACCGLGQYGGLIMCISPEMACANASKHVWWDQFHPTGAVNAIIADSVWSGLHANICYPMNLQDMVP
ncbi:hypothetical protein ACLOJK_009898 [Asimina triloba]